jgi:hypothetical protein
MNLDGYIYRKKVRAIALALPGVTEGPCYGTAGFRIKDKLLARMKEDGVTLAIRTLEREKWMQADPDTYFITDHYLNSSMMLIRLARAKEKDLQQLFLAAWLERAPKKLVKEYETRK